MDNQTNNRTPYELRLEILHLAQNIVDRRTENELQIIHLQSDSESYANLNETLGEDLLQFKNASVEEILSVAKRLNDFVSKG